MNCTCSIPISGNSHGLCPSCQTMEQAVIDRLHALKDSSTVHRGLLRLSESPDEAMEHIIALQDISNEMAVHGGERIDVRETIRRGQGWARGPVQAVCLKYGVV